MLDQMRRSDVAWLFGRPRQVTAKLLHETWIMGTLLTLDAISTVVLIATNQAKEANPIMDFYVGKGLFWFAFVKLGLFAIAPLFVLEFFRHKGSEPFVRQSLRLGIAAYVLIYVVGSVSQRI